MIKFYEGYLEPKYEKVNSYYKKARVECFGGIWSLYSYGSKVVSLDCRGSINFVRFYNSNMYSRTTLRHLREFAKQFGNQTFVEFVTCSKSKILDWIDYVGEGKEFRFSDKPDAVYAQQADGSFILNS